MRPAEVVEVLPCGQFLVQINVIRIGWELLEFLLVRPMRSLRLAVELRRSGLDIDVPDSHILDVPMELGLPLMSAVSANGVDSEWESFYHVIDEVDGACLVVPSVDLQGPDPRGVIDGRVRLKNLTST
jgi:hypothetical protein